MSPADGNESIEIDSPRGVLRLRPERDADAAFRFQLFCASQPDLALLPLAGAAHEQLMQLQFRAQTQGYHASHPHARFDIIERDGAAIGRIVVDRSAAFIHIVDQALLPGERRFGVGSAIMGALMHEASRDGRPLRLTVAAGNGAAMRLYLRLGFAPIASEPAHIAMEWLDRQAKNTPA
jgi:ribosomal protein S18 acetylase RimI-like enzyme